MTKPWEGKYLSQWKHDLLHAMEKHGLPAKHEVDDYFEYLEEALKKDWEEQRRPIIYHEEWGGCLRAIIDGKPQNIADHMNKKYKEEKAPIAEG